MKKKAIDLTIRELFEIALNNTTDYPHFKADDVRITVNPNDTKQIFLSGYLGGGCQYYRVLEYDDLVEIKKGA